MGTEYCDNAVGMNPKGLPKTVGADPEAAFDVTQMLLAKTAPDAIDDE